MRSAKVNKQVQNRIMTIIGKLQELHTLCLENNINLYPEIHTDGLEQDFMAAYMKVDRN